MSLLSALSSWLRRVKSERHNFKDIAELREVVMAAVKRRPGVDSVSADSSDPARFEVAAGDQTFTGDLTNIFGYLLAYPDAEDTDEVIERFINSITELKTLSEANIVAVVRSLAYVDYFKSQGVDILHGPLGADLAIIYMADRPDSMATLTAKDVPGKDLEDIRKIAIDNMRRWLSKVVADDRLQSGVLYYVKDNEMLSTSLILFDEFWKSISARFPGDVLIALPRRDQLFIFDDGSPEAKMRARRLIDTTTRENFNLLSPELYARRNGKIVLVTD